MKVRTEWLVDALLAVAATGLALATLHGLRDQSHFPTFAYAVVGVHTGALAVRRRFPLATLATMVVTGTVMARIGVPILAPGPVILFSIYAVASRCEPGLSLAGLAAAVAALALQGLDLGGTATWALIMGGAWFLGNYVRSRRAYAADLERRAAELQRAREELAEQAVAAERLRIARELHDVVAHTMSVIAVQSGMGAHVIDTQPAEAKKALAAIEVASRSGLAELRRLLGVLRDDAGPDGPGGPGGTGGTGGRGASLSPAPGLADLDRLLADTARAGVEVELAVEGVARPLPAGVDLAAYRIVQEALTNVVKHAGTGRARVTLRYGPDDVAVVVDDDGAGSNGAAPGAGHGIAGMRERAALYGGSLTTGPRPEGGFRVAARLETAE